MAGLQKIRKSFKKLDKEVRVALEFRSGTVSAGKTLNLLMMRHRLLQSDSIVKVAVPELDKRYGLGVVRSKIGIEVKADIIINSKVELKDQIIVKPEFLNQRTYLLVDEVQFLTKRNINDLRLLADNEEWTDVVCFGLRTDYRSNSFEGSKRLLELADKITSLESNCFYCGNPASFNYRKGHENDDTQIVLGGEELYKPACGACFGADVVAWHNDELDEMEKEDQDV